MAHWFHRNPLKATAPVSFDLQHVTRDGRAKQMCNQLRQERTQLLNLLTDPNNDIPSIVTAYTKYLSLLQGFIVCADGKSGESKLRYLVKFRWTESVLGGTPSQMNDTVFEQCCMLCDVAIWYMKHGAKLAGKDDISMDEALSIHRTLRIAAGIFEAIQQEHVIQLKESIPRGSDLDRAVLKAYEYQCKAEAQEVTIARAVELKHKPALIAGLASHTATLFADAEHSLQQQDVSKFGKWRYYLLLKSLFYQCQAHTYYSEVLLAEDKCGAAIRCLQEADKLYEKSVEACKAYSKCKGAGATVKPDQHPFFRKLKLVLKRTLDKCVSENGFIYHQKVPAEVDDTVKCQSAQHGVVQGEALAIPPVSPDWTADLYLAFDITKYSHLADGGGGHAKGEQSSEAIPDVKETSVHQSDKEPKNTSGCVLS